jgi:hypothetical protein
MNPHDDRPHSPDLRPGEHVTANFTGNPLLPYFRLIEAATADAHNRERSQAP